MKFLYFIFQLIFNRVNDGESPGVIKGLVHDDKERNSHDGGVFGLFLLCPPDNDVIHDGVQLLQQHGS